MREIKFRAWDNHKMHYPTNFEFGISGVNGQTSISFVPFGELGFCTTSYIMQYTGLKDKNGKEIYEGDIVQLQAWLGVVIYNADCTRFQAQSTEHGISGFILSTNLNYSEVIGNIYQNPELLTT